MNKQESTPRKVSQMLKRRPTGSTLQNRANLGTSAMQQRPSTYQSNKMVVPQRGVHDSPGNSDDGLYAVSCIILLYIFLQDRKWNVIPGLPPGMKQGIVRQEWGKGVTEMS